ncbi:glycosyltransferase family 4 protein [Pelagibacterales bacterium SAG-MED17]|nr:glycosyltransferase family 4 protein [Pelagibacterales bacterium SAG-MED17]
MYLIVTRTFPPELGGMQNLMWGLARSLSKLNLIKVFADYHENHEEFDKSVSFSIERVSGMKLIRKYRKSYMINDYLDQNNKVECIIADHWKSLELIKTNKKKICLIHSKEINHSRGSSLNKKVLSVLNNVDHIVANSNYTKNLAVDLGVEEKKIVIINPGIDPVSEVPTKYLDEAEDILKGKKNRLITVSRFDKRKNHEKVIMAVRNLKEVYPDITYTCIGYGDEEDKLKKLVIELKLEDQVTFLKDVPSDLKNALVAKSDIFVMPSIIYKKSVEGFGIAYVEAAQYGVPSIGGKDGGASDAIIHEKTGLICDGNKLEDVYSSIDNLFRDNKYIEYGKEAKNNSENFLWDKAIEKYKRIL